MIEHVISIGLDIGTTTSQIIFSQLIIEKTTITAIPKVAVIDSTILYKSPIHFTPIDETEQIYIASLKSMVEDAYIQSGIDKNNVSLGARIITGETSRKKNAEAIAHALSAYAGDFVSASAGPDLESLLAGRGSGAVKASKQYSGTIINFDIGGGTTNAAVCKNGKILYTFALDIGGRLVRINDDGVITYVSDRLAPLLEELNLSIQVGNSADIETLTILTDKMSQILYDITHQTLHDDYHLYIGDAYVGPPGEYCMFSGGVGQCFYNTNTALTNDAPTEHINGDANKYSISSEHLTLKEISIFGDIGPLLGASLRKIGNAQSIPILPSSEQLRATVIGAGSYSVNFSGSTIITDDTKVPLKNVPILPIETFTTVGNDLQRLLPLYEHQYVALALNDNHIPSYKEILQLGNAIAEGLKYYEKDTIVIIVHEDYGKALGLTLRRLLPNCTPICLDKLHVTSGDYVDIGQSIAGVVPVVIKSLLFKT